jgi:hypothetical protein
MPIVVAKTNTDLSNQEFFLIAQMMPKNIPMHEAMTIELNAKTAVSGKVSMIMSYTGRLVI